MEGDNFITQSTDHIAIGIQESTVSEDLRIIEGSKCCWSFFVGREVDFLYLMLCVDNWHHVYGEQTGAGPQRLVQTNPSLLSLISAIGQLCGAAVAFPLIQPSHFPSCVLFVVSRLLTSCCIWIIFSGSQCVNWWCHVCKSAGFIVDMKALTPGSFMIHTACQPLNPFPWSSYTNTFSLSKSTLNSALHSFPVEIKLDESEGVWIVSLNFNVTDSPLTV